MNIDREWEAPSLGSDDEALISAYLSVGLSVDELPHTEAITGLVKRLGQQPTDAAKHGAFKRLLRLRKMGVLPRITSPSASDSSSMAG